MAKVVINEPSFYRVLNEKGWTQRDLADAMGVTRQAVSKILNGKTILKKTFYRICMALDVEPEQLLDKSATDAIPEQTKKKRSGERPAKPEKIHVTIRITPWLKNELEHDAALKGLPLNSLISFILGEHINKFHTQNKREA